ncbi:type I-E CRISPR-associated protein Cas5/CasD [Parenemella sanctibonifatiensis]|uniref:Type I-E CRISPR-associated protein Cas5/CasD n=1 Tax=Parenemella sanctibonifatiensis TaxID=2016505 RepID=A0A255EJ20_9ACTN|nr:type I-E CRISPR-associated protein Cas5/CasD [Parenemella sanctibonifatiensis]OYN89422.1 type I-E CRISPR-associated protein Cas5/CasD [Parenemella sanctibonifatiensis]
MAVASIVLRLAGPLQSWGTVSEFNRRSTDQQPSKSGIVGLLAAASGRRRGETIADLVGLEMGVRADQPGSLLRDYHTVSALDRGPLLSSNATAKGWQKPTTPKKFTHVTTRFYLQDAAFVAIVRGESRLIETLADSLQHPVFPLFLGRRSCPPADPLLVNAADGSLTWDGTMQDLLKTVPWQAGVAARQSRRLGSTVRLAATVDAADGDDLAGDIPVNFAHRDRAFSTRRVQHLWVEIPTGMEPDADAKSAGHDPFALLGW